MFDAGILSVGHLQATFRDTEGYLPSLVCSLGVWAQTPTSTIQGRLAESVWGRGLYVVFSGVVARGLGVVARGLGGCGAWARGCGAWARGLWRLIFGGSGMWA